jgi:hypothetical protein
MATKDNHVALFDRDHAAKIFIPNNFGLAPKYGWLFHVAFDINPEISRVSNDDVLRMGLIVKSASLPKFTVESKTMNAYNRVDIVQTKVKYDQVTIKLHDDNLDVMRNFWYDYYSYYYRDADWNENIYAAATKYSERQNQTWGYTPRQYPASVSNTQQYLSAVRIYSLHNKKFAEYTLLNPIITQFQHGEHAQGGESGTLENSMTIQFQAVKYQYGQVSEDTVTGFAHLTYDSRASTLGTTNVTDHSIHDLAEGMTGLPGIVNNLKNLNGTAIVGAALGAGASALLTGGIPAIGAGIGAAGSALKSGWGKAKSAWNDAFPSDGTTAKINPQAEVDAATAQLTADEDALTQANADLEAGKAEQAQLEAQIESDTYTLEYDPNLSEEDISALQQIITDNKAKLVSVIENNATLEENITGLTDAVFADQERLKQAQEAANPSGNSADDGGVGADSTTTFDAKTGTTTEANPDGSETMVDGLGDYYTVPQQKPVDNPNAASNEQAPSYTGPSVVYAPDGSSSPVDSLGNVQKTLVNGSYNN